MSPSEVDTVQSPVQRRAGHPVGLFLSELSVTFRRLRTYALLAAYAAVPVLLGVVIYLFASPGDHGGPNFIGSVVLNGVFLVFVSLFFLLPLFLPVGVAVVAGDSLAGEAHQGTLRYLLVAPAGRARLLFAKLLAVLVFCLAAALTVYLVAVAVGAILFPRGEVPSISGVSLSYGEGLWRGLLAAGYVAASLTGLAAIGVFVSSLVETPLAAMATTVAVPLVSQILDAVPQIEVIHAYLPTHYWLTLADLLRDPIYADNMLTGLVVQLVYVLIFGSAAYARMTTRDVA
ncbi:MAG: ABC transporter permease subunit [Streptosporangiales bacterium]|nr:ABC transporter permease subunit [Streptosporangiales bacterium]